MNSKAPQKQSVSPDYDKGYEDGFEDGHNAGYSEALDRKETLSVLIYFCNKWSPAEAKHIANGDEWLGNHLWEKWEQYADRHGSTGGIAPYFLDLDSGLTQMIAERACELYCGRRNK